MPVNNNANAEGGNNKNEAKVDQLPIGTILAGKYKLTELAQSHPVLGLTYNAISQEGDGYIVKVDSEKNLLSLVRSEAGFLQAVIHANACDHFVQFMHGARYQKIIYFVSRFRPGPSLNQCLGAMSEGKFTVGTAVRVAYHISKAIDVVHNLNYLLRRMDPNVIKFDVHTKSIYLSDLSSVRVDPAKIKLNATVKWAGPQLYAPMQHHNGGSVEARHDVEALVFLLVDMTTAKLPWENCPPDMVASAKRQSITDQTLFNGCPSQYSALYTYISCLTSDDKINYEQIWRKMEEAWQQAGIKDVKEKYDWEVNAFKLDPRSSNHLGSLGNFSLNPNLAEPREESSEESQRRFEIECEFVQSLANPHYITYIAQRGFFKEQYFLNYLKYLLYWKRPEYAKCLKFPQCLSMLENLQNPEFREAMVLSSNAKFVEDQLLLQWHFYLRKRARILQTNHVADEQQPNSNERSEDEEVEEGRTERENDENDERRIQPQQ